MSYALDNAAACGFEHVTGLAGLYDPFTRERISRLLALAGKTCLEVGAGCGSIAHWLADQVGPHGYVVATDLNPVHIEPHPRMRVVAHDLAAGDPLPVDQVDLVHARMVLAHVPPRDQVLEALIGRLRPGGVILIEDLNGASGVARVLSAPSGYDADLYTRYMKHRTEIFAAAGTDSRWVAGLPGLLMDAGLQDVELVVYTRSWHGGSPGSRHALGTLTQFSQRLMAFGTTADDIDLLKTMLDDPAFRVVNHPLYSVSGYVPS